MRNMKHETEDQFYEAMPGMMDRGMVESDQSWMRNMLPWLIIPAAVLLLKAAWEMTSDKPEMRDMRRKMREMPDKLKDSAQKMMDRHDK